MNEDTATDWRDLPEFAGMDLSQSFVLGWERQSGMLVIDVDLLLTPEHAWYEKPRPAEKVCIRPAAIEFPHFEGVESDAGTALDTFETGAISGMQRLADGRYEICGDFGTVRIDAERPTVRFKVP